nr:polysaccharide deacetylase family protein [Candidatus Sigynarchaeota archaeon]
NPVNENDGILSFAFHVEGYLISSYCHDGHLLTPLKSIPYNYNRPQLIKPRSLPMKKPAYLTVDDGPSMATPEKLRALDALGIQAIWFARGEFMDLYPKMAKEIIVAGHVLANHSYNHPYFSRISLQECQHQFLVTEVIINTVYQSVGISRPPLHCFRFPWGDKGTGHDLSAFSTTSRQAWESRLGIMQAFLRGQGIRQPAFQPVTHAWYLNASLDKDVDTYWTIDPEEWRLISKNSRRRLSSLEDVIGTLKYRVSSNPTGSPEIIVVHDFEDTQETFIPIIEALQGEGLDFQPIPLLARD